MSARYVSSRLPAWPSCAATLALSVAKAVQGGPEVKPLPAVASYCMGLRDQRSLAREQYAYCNDLVDQGTESVAALAAGLLDGTVWYFWWD